jgi:hypothetical protein
VEERVTLEWTFTPEDFFEVPYEHKGERCIFDIKNGKVIADVSALAATEYTNVHDELNGLFLGAQLIEHGSYTLSDFVTVHTRSDGTRNIAVTARLGLVVAVSGKTDFTITDAQGNVKHDSRAERIRDRREIAALAAKHRADPIAMAILKSYRAAAEEPKIELIRLYEIRDALAKYFGSAHIARKVLGISDKGWRRLGQLADDAPLNQGRHRGKKVGELRDATEAELNEARKIAHAMIRAYLKQIREQALTLI